MESADMVLRPRSSKKPRRRESFSALVGEKENRDSFTSGCEVVMAAETPTGEWVERLGPAPDIYSPEINHWLLKAAIWLLKNRSDLGVLYIHTTDYPCTCGRPRISDPATTFQARCTLASLRRRLPMRRYCSPPITA